MADPKSLSEKLKRADGKGLTLALAQQTIEHYFFAVGDMLGDGRFDNIYNSQIIKHMKGEQALVCQFLHQLPRTQERTELLYQILIEPYLAMRAFDSMNDEEDIEEEEDDDDTDDY